MAEKKSKGNHIQTNENIRKDFMQSNISSIDFIVVLVYLGGIFFLALKSGRASYKGENLIDNQYLAGKSLTIPESLCSIIATEVSALTFLGIPAFAYGGDFSFIQIYMGALFGRLAIAFVFLQKIYDRGHHRGGLGGGS